MEMKKIKTINLETNKSAKDCRTVKEVRFPIKNLTPVQSHIDRFNNGDRTRSSPAIGGAATRSPGVIP